MSKALKENYIIRIKSQIEQDGETEEVELMTRGSFVRRGGSFFISAVFRGQQGCCASRRRRGKQGAHARDQRVHAGQPADAENQKRNQDEPDGSEKNLMSSEQLPEIYVRQDRADINHGHRRTAVAE